MNRILSFFIKIFVTIAIMTVVGVISVFAFHLTSFLLVVLLGGLLSYWITSIYVKYQFLKKHGLKSKEYRYIKKNLEEAKGKVTRLQKSLIAIRHIPSLKQRIELIKVSKKIYTLTKKEPKRFYQAESFYFSHLDSAVELAEKYVFLSKQPKKSPELDQSLHEALWTLERLNKTIEEDLYKVISDDIEKLDFEIDVAKHALKKHEQS
jgi:5-bromo-4-chloroindolyl phosphate hydrolysis protein